MNSISVLLVEDETVLASLIKETLNTRGFQITVAENGVEGWRLFSMNKPDICVIDIMMPRKDGISLVTDIRKVDSLVPVIFLTAKTQTEDIIRGFEAGADDYMKKPFSIEELIVRLKSLYRRTVAASSANKTNLSGVFAVGSFEFNYQELSLTRGDVSISLSQRETELLKLLVENKNELLDRETALLKIWGDDNPFNARSMDVYITRLRKYLVDDQSVRIFNIRGYGYKLAD
jgi:two-component system, OmpR family, response regulator TrcR